MAASQYPYTQPAMLSNSVTTSTTVSIINGMQVATTTFSSAAGSFGQITLSPVQNSATNVEMGVGHQKLSITSLTFRAAFGFDSGQVLAVGHATDQNGNDPVAFSEQICQWPNNP